MEKWDDGRQSKAGEQPHRKNGPFPQRETHGSYDKTRVTHDGSDTVLSSFMH